LPGTNRIGNRDPKRLVRRCVQVARRKLASIREADDSATHESHFGHTVRNSVCHGGSIPAIGARALGRDTRVIGLSWADEVQLILTLPESGIRSVRDLKGRRFGLPN
jgi:ABC-type nitrate/sulfonate/bicarbonate transport system substrate-binding protein